MAGMTWVATIRLPENGDQVRVQVVAPTQFDARQLIELQYDDAQILFGPIRPAAPVPTPPWSDRRGSAPTDTSWGDDPECRSGINPSP
jgi:hypothetical protein